MLKTEKRVFLMLLSLTLAGCSRDSEEVEAAEQVAAPMEPQGFSKLEWKIVDRNKALAENPKLVEVENDTNASDPVSAIMQASRSAISRINKISMEHNATLQSFVNATESGEDPKPISFEEFNAAAKLNSNNVKGLYRWQAYAYSETTGKVTILEDREEKRRIYEESGREFKVDD
jgi:hypothetical protein